ncbi:MAG: nucleotidyltransferase family protein [Bacteroidales bacterium]|nr:nucleotidyltransferase family protein [Bacteroidales bacterium]
MNQSIASKIADYFATKPVVRAFVFGSFARGENGPDSDIDILVSFDRSARVSLFDHVRMTYDLEDILGMEVDLVTEGTLLPRVATSAEQDKVLVYERAS